MRPLQSFLAAGLFLLLPALLPARAAHAQLTFTLTTPLVYPVCVIVIGFFMRRAMQRCLLEMERLLTMTSNLAPVPE